MIVTGSVDVKQPMVETDIATKEYSKTFQKEMALTGQYSPFMKKAQHSPIQFEQTITLHTYTLG